MYQGKSGTIRIGEKIFPVVDWSMREGWHGEWERWKSNLKHPTSGMEQESQLKGGCEIMEKSYRVGDKLVRVGLAKEHDWTEVPVGGVVEVDNVVNSYGWGFKPNTRWSNGISLCVGIPAGSRKIGGLSCCGCWKLIGGKN